MDSINTPTKTHFTSLGRLLSVLHAMKKTAQHEKPNRYTRCPIIHKRIQTSGKWAWFCCGAVLLLVLLSDFGRLGKANCTNKTMRTALTRVTRVPSLFAPVKRSLSDSGKELYIEYPTPG
jgi:hypothetical protein